MAYELASGKVDFSCLGLVMPRGGNKMKIRLLLALAFLPSQAVAQSAPFKLIMHWNGSTVVVDYPSSIRCQTALASIQEETEKRTLAAREQTARLSKGGIILPSVPTAFCIPG
jgi:hypothetical protein